MNRRDFEEPKLLTLKKKYVGDDCHQLSERTVLVQGVMVKSDEYFLSKMATYEGEFQIGSRPFKKYRRATKRERKEFIKSYYDHWGIKIGL